MSHDTHARVMCISEKVLLTEAGAILLTKAGAQQQTDSQPTETVSMIHHIHIKMCMKFIKYFLFFVKRMKS